MKNKSPSFETTLDGKLMIAFLEMHRAVHQHWKTHKAIQITREKIQSIWLNEKDFHSNIRRTKNKFKTMIISTLPDWSINYKTTLEWYIASQNKKKIIQENVRIRAETDRILRKNWLEENWYSADRTPLKRTEKVVNFYISDKVKASLERHARDFFVEWQIIQNFTQAQALLEWVINRESNAELSTEEITYFYSYFNKLKNEHLLTNKK